MTTKARDFSTFSNGAYILSNDGSITPLVIQAAVGQTANLLEFKNSSGENVVSFGPTGQIVKQGTVLQTIVKRTDTLLSYGTGANGVGAEFTDLRVSITPKFANSMILCVFQVHGEGGGTHNYSYRIFKNGLEPSGTYAGYNNISGDVQWSGFTQALPYESDYNSTPMTQTIRYHDFPNTTSTITYAPGILSTNDGSLTYYVNRTAGSSGTTGYETGVSISIAMEVAQ
jgi:hypothetical protein